MNTTNKDITNISKIIDGLYLSGSYPLEHNPDFINKHNINYIISCVDRKHIEKIHDQLVLTNPSLTIIYLPYSDILYENLWKINDDQVYIHQHVKSELDIKNMNTLLNMYQFKNMIEIAYNFINSVISSGESVLVHCMAGISRSVSMIAYYLMKKYNMTLVDAIGMIRNKRSIANPNDSFKLQLYEYQKKRQNMTTADATNIIDGIKTARDSQ